MKIRIYQVNTERDPNNVCFMGCDRLEKLQGTTTIDSAIYDKVFGGEVKCRNLEDVWVKFNKDHPKGHMRTLKKCGIIEI